MSDIAKLNAAFHAEIGTSETPKGSNNVKYNTAFYGHEVYGDNYAWCCAFIWWVFRECGLAQTFCNGNKTAYCPFVVNWAKTHNQWVTSGYQLGDILLFDWNHDGLADHIGWCAGTAGGYAKSIEGNSSNVVKLNSQSFDKIMGAYRPKYNNTASSSIQTGTSDLKPETPVLDTTDKDPSSYTVKTGDNLWSIGQKYGVPYLEIAKANNISSPYVIRPGQVLTIPKKGQVSTPSPSSETSSDEYVVKSGDTLWGIGQKYKINYMKIANANNISSPYIIRPGQVLKIPK